MGGRLRFCTALPAARPRVDAGCARARAGRAPSYSSLPMLQPAAGAGRAGRGVVSLLEVRGLKVHFAITQGVLLDRKVGAVHAVDGVDLDIDRGTTLGVVGESGCGKTTLGRAILRLEEATSGSVTFDGVDVLALKQADMRRLRRRMQMVFQDPLGSLNPRQSVESILSEPMRTHGMSSSSREASKRVQELL